MGGFDDRLSRGARGALSSQPRPKRTIYAYAALFTKHGEVNKSINGVRSCGEKSVIGVMQFMHGMHATLARTRNGRKRAEHHPSRERTSGATKRLSSVQTADERE